MAWSIGAVTIHPDSEEFEVTTEALYSEQQVVDATSTTISWYGAASDKIALSFILDESEVAAGACIGRACARGSNGVAIGTGRLPPTCGSTCGPDGLGMAASRAPRREAFSGEVLAPACSCGPP